jgi:hypothetical protein
MSLGVEEEKEEKRRGWVVMIVRVEESVTKCGSLNSIRSNIAKASWYVQL